MLVMTLCLMLKSDFHEEDGSHDAMCSSYHNSVGVIGSDVDASLVRLSSCDWGYGFFLV